MKKIFFLMIGIIASFYAAAQQIAINDMVSITLPANAEKLSKEQIIAFADQKGYERRAMPSNPTNVYRVNDLLLQLYPFKGDFKDNDLEK